MKYVNASEILPDKLLQEIQKYTEGKAIYIPRKSEKKKWGEGSGARSYYERRNEAIRKKFSEKISIDSLATEYGLSVETIKKIVYS